MFYAARAALISVGQEEGAKGKTQSGSVSSFNEFLVKAGHIGPDMGRLFGLEHKRRLLADYEGEDMSPEDARAAIDHAEAFVSAVSVFIARHRL